jgi:SNF2 family DNA or RNA helicase
LKDEQEQREREREAARKLVRQAGKMLEESKGHLDAEMWRALYLTFDLPKEVSSRGHHLLTAIPRDVLAFLRVATGMGVHAKRSDCPLQGAPKGAGRCSKIEALLRDLPKGERSVIFSLNKDCLKHIQAILDEESIGCQSIYTGQSPSDLKKAVAKWESEGSSPSDPPPCPCLLVQAGAAAAGLTLTAASKMFLMEPFLKQEQEHQAYARCHRYSQKHKVSVKVYYTPVSVESRLLDWRKGAKKTTGDLASDKDFESNFEEDTKVIYHDVNEDSGDEEEDGFSSEGRAHEKASDFDYNGDDIAQANFLLGLNN